MVSQALPLQPVGPKPIYLNDVKLENVDDSKSGQSQTFLQRYVS